MKIKKILLPLIAVLTFTTACSDMMDMKSDRIVTSEDHRLDNANDSIYSIIGVLSKVQNIADRCLLMGELRGDLMTIDAANASSDLQQINQFAISSGNKYANKRDFYNVINNCNYILANMDTTLVEGQSKVMMPEFAQVKTLRAWTYMQMALIFGKVNYFTRPLVSVADIDAKFEEIDIDQLSQRLIADLLPMANIRPLNYGAVDGWNSAEFFIPTKQLLGDLFLYNNKYQQAAEMYYALIKERRLTVSNSFSSFWKTPTRDELNNSHLTAYRNDVLTRIVFNSDLSSRHSQLLKLTYSVKPSLLPAEWFTSSMQKRTHFHSSGQAISRYLSGDLRGCAEYSNGKTTADAFGPVALEGMGRRMLITKYYNNLNGTVADKLVERPLTSLAIYTPSMLYLRYAEAINRLDKPSIAFAVLKYGLSDATLSDTLKVDSNEVKNLPSYIDFTSNAFNVNVGTASRGCGLGIKFDGSQYVIPSGVDSVEYVEERILEEMAAESCFEGNRFFDLLCISRHRTDHPKFLADKVSAKYVDSEYMRQRLMDKTNWWAAW